MWPCGPVINLVSINIIMGSGIHGLIPDFRTANDGLQVTEQLTWLAVIALKLAPNQAED